MNIRRKNNYVILAVLMIILPTFVAACNSTIGDRVWDDLNRNGVQDVDEPGIPDITVKLYDCNDVLVATTTTDADGMYSFTVAPGDYYVKFTLADGMVFSPMNAGAYDVDSDADTTTGMTVCTTLDRDEVDLTWDAGMYVPDATIGDRVWNDLNENGVQDVDEPGIPDITVKLYNCDGNLVDTTATDADGMYSFTAAPGDYYVKFMLPGGMVFSPADQGADDALDSDADTTTGMTVCTTLDPDEVDLTWDAGMYVPDATIGDLVWNDLNENGVQDVDEPGIPDITVKLYDCDDNLVDTTTTDATGLYSFTVAPGDYYVKFTTPEGMVFSPADQGTDDAIDSDADTTTGMTVCTTLDSDEVDLTWDAGMYVPDATIGDLVWNDLNENGIQDPDEPGIPDVTVELYNCDGNLVDTTATDADGMYSFTVAPGDYYVKFILPGGMVFSPADQGADDALDSDADTTTGMTVCTTLDRDEVDLTWDAGMYCITAPGTGTPGYWKNHPEAWPVEEITIGGVIYTKEKAIGYMRMPEKGDKTYTIFRALVSAKLNVHIGNDASCIADTITAADEWMETHGPVGSGIRANSDAWKDGEPLYIVMDDYNNGLLCASSRDELGDE